MRLSLLNSIAHDSRGMTTICILGHSSSMWSESVEGLVGMDAL